MKFSLEQDLSGNLVARQHANEWFRYGIGLTLLAWGGIMLYAVVSSFIMKHHLVIPFLAWAVVAQAGPKPIVIPAEPAEAARAFYTELRRLNVDGLPKGEAWLALNPRLTPELANAIVGAQAEQAAFIKQNPDEKPPWIEGDLFSSLFEGPQKFEVGKATVTGDKAEVSVTCTHTEGSHTAKWTDTLLMSKAARGWLLDDIRYGGTWNFASKGTLKQSLAPVTE